MLPLRAKQFWDKGMIEKASTRPQRSVFHPIADWGGGGDILLLCSFGKKLSLTKKQATEFVSMRLYSIYNIHSEC